MLVDKVETIEERTDRMIKHLEFSIKHGGFAVGEHAHGGCSCHICSYLRGYLIVNHYSQTGEWLAKNPIPKNR